MTEPVVTLCVWMSDLPMQLSVCLSVWVCVASCCRCARCFGWCWSNSKRQREFHCWQRFITIICIL